MPQCERCLQYQTEPGDEHECNPSGYVKKLEEDFEKCLNALDRMHQAFWGTSESECQDEANDEAKSILKEFGR